MSAIPSLPSDDEINYIYGTISSVHVNGRFAVVYLNETIEDVPRFDEPEARIDVDGVGSFPLFDVINSNSIQLYGNGPGDFAALTSGQVFRLYDDDTELIPLPMNSPSTSAELMARMQACYAAAFIKPVLYANPRPEIDFVLNQSPNPIMFPNWKDAKDGEGTSYFWYQLIALGYQPQESFDRDGESEGDDGGTPEAGITGLGFNAGSYCAIFTETIRENDIASGARIVNLGNVSMYLDAIALTMAHEVGHVPGTGSESADHAEGGLMKMGGADSVDEEFSAASLLRFRSIP